MIVEGVQNDAQRVIVRQLAVPATLGRQNPAGSGVVANDPNIECGRVYTTRNSVFSVAAAPSFGSF